MSLLRAALELGLSDAAALVLEEIALEDRSPRARVQTLRGGREWDMAAAVASVC
jgi:hypothetical protein